MKFSIKGKTRIITLAAFATAMVSTLILLTWELYTLGLQDTLSAIAAFARDAFRNPIVLIPLGLLIGIPLTLLTVYGGDIGKALDRRLLLFLNVVIALWLLFAITAIWVIPFSRFCSDYTLAYRLFDRGEYERSVARFQKLLANTPSPKQAAEYRFQIAASYYEQGDYRTALDLYLKCVEVCNQASTSPNPALSIVIGDCYARLQDFTRAKEWYIRNPEMVPDPEQRIRAVTIDPSAPLGAIPRK